MPIAQADLAAAFQTLNAIGRESGANVQLGTLLFDLIAAHNQLEADHNTLRTQYEALLAHLDTADVAGIGNANAATYGTAASTATAPLLGSL
jgi:hypothetical protein